MVDIQPMIASLRTDVGRVREHNEDFVGSWEPTSAAEAQTNGWLYIVADGVGGAEAGEIASQHATELAIRHYINLVDESKTSERLKKAIQAANVNLRELAEQRKAVRAMATTMVAAVLQGESVTIANVGDSRAYHIHGDTIKQITKDQSLVAKLIEEGTLTEAEAAIHPQRNVILSSLGSSREPFIDIYTVILNADELLLLCSDGLTRHVDNNEIADVAMNYPPNIATQQLIELANERGGGDNISIAIIQQNSFTQQMTQENETASTNNQPVATQSIGKRWKLWTYTLFLSMVQSVLITLIYYLVNVRWG